jgi:phosphate-selective porin OprO/OprP
MPATTIHNDAWQVAATYILTGEVNSFQGVKPHNPFSPANGGWGALELAGRFGRLEIDNEAFPMLAAAGSASKATSWGAGVNWYLNRNLKLSLDYEQTYFKDGSSKRGTVTAQDEKIVFSRIQLAF